MSAKYVRDYYGVSFKRGDRITVDGRPGTIVSFPGQYIGVRFDGQTYTQHAHPTWRVAYEECPTLPDDQGDQGDPSDPGDPGRSEGDQ